MSREPVFNFSLDDLIAAVDREIGMRFRVFPNLVNRGKMTTEESQREIALMRAVAANLKTQLSPPPQSSLNL